MRIISLLVASLSLISAQLPAFSRQAWNDSLSATPTLLYGPVGRGGIAGNDSYYKTPKRK